MGENLYPIRAVSKLIGVPVDTIRSWERRHGLVSPLRGPGGGRMFSDEQVQRLTLVRDALAKGFSVGQLAKVDDEELRLLGRMPDVHALESEERFEMAVAANQLLAPLIQAIEQFDYTAAEREVNRLAAAMADPRDIVHEIALPLMKTVGDRWHEGTITIAQEHMVTALLTGLLASMLRAYGNPNPAVKVLMATPENEHHGFGILAAAMLTAAKGMGALHLGANLPASEIVLAAKKTSADAVLLGVCGANPDKVIAAMEEIRKGLRGRIQMWIGGTAEERVTHAAEEMGWSVLKNFRAFEDELEKLAAVA
ncbi:MAG TPA: B12-binding domain-containing protein [Candidatus Bathyarchaeia archaeon]|nr:B12-binding domain-containing protein [Candidatus Bathyarchaeia archaeon]